ncbi:thiopeptide-type bacteriocin biosynthesis protein [Aquimarina brevivitae]|uniref:Thiopeptide-type bacteriocin biosynthesis protein n=1 Tax=Aquimarina brevivitae TaxID=323412 RepID=A0A4Q7PI00_9FLAO|nr:thiopeptide-type bacteriocin biosynthesis protein [Aquimarina brevivitae]RZS99430.1 thiopeptide-type bacteriocin biosynthesis protein [Aquimarina brevivitae]
MTTKRIYIPGQEWVYYKIYCGARTSDRVLTDSILPFAQQLVKQGIINKWFFIRYTDPDFHLRVRFLLADINRLGDLMIGFQNAMSPYLEEDIIYKIQTDTYNRELERYGAENIETSETLFYHESNMLVQAMGLVEDDALYFNFILKAIDTLLNDFSYRLEEKIKFASTNRDAFWREFKGNKQLTKQLDKKYRAHNTAFTEFLTTQVVELAPLDNLLRTKSENTVHAIDDCKAYLEKPNTQAKDSLLASYVHMLVNRAFRSKQRFFELVCYDFLLKHYKSLKYTSKKT